MLGQQFYHETMRKVVVAFGTMFNDINLVRTNNAGEVIQTMKVPLAYGPKQKWLARLQEDPNITKKVAVTLPRLGFEIQTISYDSTRKLNSIQKLKKVNSSAQGKTMSQQFMPVPYNMDFQMAVMAKNSDDALQIVEQIIPYFAPQYTLTIKPFNEFDNITEDVPIILTGVNFNDDYEGEQGTRRTIQYTLTFDMHIYFHGKIDEGSIIREVNANTLIMNSGLTGDSDVPLERINLVPNPLSVSPDSDFGFTETFILAADSDAGVI